MQIHLPPKLLAFCIVLMFALHYAWPITTTISHPYNFLGLLVIAVGVSLGMWTKRTMKKQNTTLHPDRLATSLITTGPFRLSRNPYYVSYLTISLGLALVLGSLSVFVGPLFFFLVLNWRVIPVEEQNLQKGFGQVYTSYAQQVRRWL